VKRRPGLVLSAVLISGAALFAPVSIAEQEFRSNLNDSDNELISEGAGRYRECIVSASSEALPDFEDARHALGMAVRQCESVIQSLEQALAENNLNPGLSHGIVRRIKNQTIQKSLPGLFAAKAAQTAAP